MHAPDESGPAVRAGPRKGVGRTMNMIPCDKRCIHQRDGCCTVFGTAAPTAMSGECSYFVPVLAREGGFKGKAQRIRSDEDGILRKP